MIPSGHDKLLPLVGEGWPTYGVIGDGREGQPETGIQNKEPDQKRKTRRNKSDAF